MIRKKLVSFICMLVIISAFSITVPSKSSNGNTIYVDDDVESKYTVVQDVIDIDKPSDEYDVTIQGGIGITITVIYEEEFDDDLNLSLVFDGFIIFAIDSEPTYIALCDGRVKMVDRIITIGVGLLSIQVLINGEVVKEAEGMMIGLFVFLDEK